MKLKAETPAISRDDWKDLAVAVALSSLQVAGLFCNKAVICADLGEPPRKRLLEWKTA